MVFRELGQEPDGDLSTRFPAELIPATGKGISISMMTDTLAGKLIPGGVDLQSTDGIGAAYIEKVPVDARITLKIDPSGNNEETGLYLRSREKGPGGYKLSFSANNREVCLGNTCIADVNGLDQPFKLDIIMSNDILDVCVNGKRCIVNRQPEQKGDFLWFYVKHGKAVFRSVKVRGLIQ